MPASDDGEYRSILVAVDDSSHAAAALARAIEIAGRSGARLTLLHVIQPACAPVMGPAYVPPALLQTRTDEEAEALLERAAAAVPAHVPVHTVVRHGLAAQEIVRRVEAAGHDLVVMGSRGRGRIRSLLLGSVSRAVARRSPAPVLVVPADAERRPPPRSRGEGVLSASAASARGRTRPRRSRPRRPPRRASGARGPS